MDNIRFIYGKPVIEICIFKIYSQVYINREINKKYT